MSGYCKDCGNQHCICDGIYGVSQGYDKYIKYNVLTEDEMKERQAVSQLSTAEMNMCIDFLNRMIYEEKLIGIKDTDRLCKLLQHMIYCYENYEHWAVITGYFSEKEHVNNLESKLRYQKEILKEVYEFNDHWGTGNYHRLPIDLEEKIKCQIQVGVR